MFLYGKEFADVYNAHWIGFATRLAPLIHAWHEAGAGGRRILDVCCGTGQLLLYFLERGYSGTGVDISAPMLSHAHENCRMFEADGKMDFLEADASDFSLAARYDIAVSTFDALNHIESLQKLQSCFRCVRAALAPGGVFLFDLNTEKGLRRWNGINVQDEEDFVIINRSVFGAGMDRACSRITGFTKSATGGWTRFENTAFNTVFLMNDVRRALAEAGFSESWFVSGSDLDLRITDPEEQERAFVIARA